jgi:hypothetical protein
MARQVASVSQGVMRSTSSVVTFWVAVIIVGIVIVAPIVRGDWAFLGFVAPLSAFLIWVTWLVLMRPQVRYSVEGVEVINIGRVHVLHWARIASVRQGVNLAFELEDGSRIQAWGVSFPRQRSALLAGLRREPQMPQRDLDKFTAPLEQLRVAAEPSDAQVTRHWDLRPMILGVALFVILVVAIVVPFVIGIAAPDPGARVL